MTTTASRKKSWVLDYETICNMFACVVENLFTKEVRKFAVWPEGGVNQLPEFIEFLEECEYENIWHLGFNILGFDSQITEFILAHKEQLLALDPHKVVEEIYRFAQRTIHLSNSKERPDYPEYELKIKCQDIFRMNNWDSNAKRTSLKWAQYTMDWHNVEEMPHPHDEPVVDRQTFDKVMKYCVNDVHSTKAIYLKNKFDKKTGKYAFEMLDQIALRHELSKTYNLNLYSAPEPRISKQVFRHFLMKNLRMKRYDVDKLRTFRDTVDLGKIILPMVRFETTEFRSMLNWFRGQIVNTKLLEESEQKKKSKFKYSIMHKGVQTDYGLGGLHGCAPSGIYRRGKGRIIMSADVTSFYPNLAIKNKWSPAQLPRNEFCRLYEWFFEERKKYDKKNPLNYLFKIILNATYGLSKNRHSFLYDPEFTFRITINGQLQLSMLYEMISTRIPGSQPLMQNTDGLEFMIDEEYRPLFESICKEWEKMTQLQLEFVEYDRMIIGDVNNYIAVDIDGKTKCKGRFEFEDLPLHKNKSHLVIPKALYAYFIDGIQPEDYLQSNRNIFDYCAGAKLRGDWKFEKVYVSSKIDEKYYSYGYKDMANYLAQRGWQMSWSTDNWVRSDAKNKEANTGVSTRAAFWHEVTKENSVVREVQQKMVRYYNSKRGAKLYKCHPDGRQIQLESGRVYQTVFNRYENREWHEYEVDEKYYLRKIRKEIDKIKYGKPLIKGSEKKQQQLTLF